NGTDPPYRLCFEQKSGGEKMRVSVGVDLHKSQFTVYYRYEGTDEGIIKKYSTQRYGYKEFLGTLRGYKGKGVEITVAVKAKEILLLYRNKDCVEKSFDNMKNELSSNRLRVHSRGSMEGRLFISFLSLILYSFIHNIMREKNLVKKYTIEEVFYEIKKLKIIELENKRKILTEISKTQKELFMNLINEVPKLWPNRIPSCKMAVF
ncbi:MAG: hypothetical protein J7K04_04270, partial [Spirochaetales bacterium]|nr:hypothetical protein [Spirochaetales bacterium]